VNDIHNQQFDKELDGHLVQGRLKPEDMDLVSELTRNLVPPRNIMSTMKERDPDNVTNKKQIYNARHRLRKKGVRGMKYNISFIVWSKSNMSSNLGRMILMMILLL
jgi:hypothetical protein